MTNNFQHIAEHLLEFTNEGDFYNIEIIRRRKENPELERNAKKLKMYAIYSKEQLFELEYRIIEYCKAFNARAYIRVNRRNDRDVALEAMARLAKAVQQGHYGNVKTIYDKAVGQCNSESKDKKKWVIDLDNDTNMSEVEFEAFVNERANFINECQPVGDKIITRLNTRSGVHLITRPFNKAVFMSEYSDIDIHTDNPTLLYIP